MGLGSIAKERIGAKVGLREFHQGRGECGRNGRLVVDGNWSSSTIVSPPFDNGHQGESSIGGRVFRELEGMLAATLSAGIAHQKGNQNIGTVVGQLIVDCGLQGLVGFVGCHDPKGTIQVI